LNVQSLKFVAFDPDYCWIERRYTNVAKIIGQYQYAVKL